MPALSPHLRLAPAVVDALDRGARVAVIGPTGWLGGAALAMLDRALPGDALADRVAVFGSRRRTLALPSGRTLPCHDLQALPDLAGATILHFAYLTRERAGAIPADAFVATNEAIHAAVLAAARRASGVFFASSGAVYQVPDQGADASRPAAERDLYGWMKRRHERDFAALDVASVVARIFSVAGEYINKPENYALSSMLVALRGGGPVRLRSGHEVWRSYAYVGDIVNLALSLLLAGRGEPPFDLAGAEGIEIGQLAALCAAVTNRADAAIERPPATGAAADVMLGDPARYHALLAELAMAPLPLDEQVRATAGYLDAVRAG